MCKTQEYLDLASVIIVVIKPDHSVELINRKGCEVLGFDKEEIEGKNWINEFIPAEDRESVRKDFTRMFKGDLEPIEYYESVLFNRENEVRVIQWHNAYLKNDLGEIIAILCSGDDVTLKKILQNKLAIQEVEKRKQILAAILEAQENERHEIAYELHDNVNQILTTCKILLESEIKSNNPSRFIANSYVYLQNAIDEIRDLSHRLNPSQLEDIGLEGSITELLQRLSITSRFHTEVEINDPEALKKIDYRISLSLFRIVQEQLTNILKHSGASIIKVSINVMPHFVDIEIVDDGKGFHIKSTPKGLGLKNIRNRAEFHGGRYHISSSPGEGCILSVCLPNG
ncbi:MAG TPA: PAS domain-containing sensor histidine kinase [Chitinophagaceae bacterium]|nr:PAS domain-containing sensor histidine kinase [Chitinophagaceae bacterium]